MKNSNIQLNLPTFTDDNFIIDMGLYEPKILKDEEALIQYIDTILGTKKDSIEFEDFGFNLEDYLFSLPDTTLTMIIMTDLRNVIKKYLPQVEISENSYAKLVEGTNRPTIYIFLEIIANGATITYEKQLGGDFEEGLNTGLS